MSDVRIDKLRRGDSVLWARVLANYGEYDIYDLKVRTVAKTWIVATDPKTHKAYTFNDKDASRVLFKKRKDALAFLKEEKVKNKNVHVATE